MTFDLTDFLTADEIATVRASAEAEELADTRKAETAEAVATAADSFAAYWAESVSASVLRDYRAGRVS